MEDILASIRRILSEEDGSADGTSPPAEETEPGPDVLLLDPSMMVTDTAPRAGRVHPVPASLLARMPIPPPPPILSPDDAAAPGEPAFSLAAAETEPEEAPPPATVVAVESPLALDGFETVGTAPDPVDERRPDPIQERRPDPVEERSPEPVPEAAAAADDMPATQPSDAIPVGTWSEVPTADAADGQEPAAAGRANEPEPPPLEEMPAFAPNEVEASIAADPIQAIVESAVPIEPKGDPSRPVLAQYPAPAMPPANPRPPVAQVPRAPTSPVLVPVPRPDLVASPPPGRVTVSRGEDLPLANPPADAAPPYRAGQTAPAATTIQSETASMSASLSASAQSSGGGIASPETANAAAGSVTNLIRALTSDRAAQMYGGGPTIADLVREEMRPMLKAWLDANLPPLVERLVRAEIERVISRVSG